MCSKALTIIQRVLAVAVLVGLQATTARAQTEIRQNFQFEGPPNTIVPGVPPVTNCQVTPDFGPAHGTTVPPFTGSSYVGFHEQFFHDTGVLVPNEIFSIELDRTLTSGTAYTYRLMARIAQLGFGAGMNASNRGGNSGSFDIYAGATPCATTQLVGTVSLIWPADDAWGLRTLSFTANASHRYLTYVAAAQPDPTNGTYFGIDDPRMDYGDAPDTFGTRLLVEGPRHAITVYDAATNAAPLMLGSRVDAEGDGEPHPDASLDQFDDGVVPGGESLVTGATTASVLMRAVNATASDATLAAWIDFDGSGVFDPGERASLIVPANTLVPTVFNVSWAGLAPLPASFSALSRFRIATNPTEVTLPTGTATDGEVEDHRVPIVIPPVQLTITKVSTPKPAIPGLPMTYTIVARNDGPVGVTDARIQDAVPAALAGFTWTCVQPVGACSVPNGTGTIDTLVDLGPGEQVTITLAGTLSPDHIGVLTNLSTITPPPGVLTDCPVGNPTCRESVDENPPQPTAELIITKVGTPRPATAGQTLTYTITVVNNGPSTVTGARVQDPVQPELAAFTWTCVQPSGSCSVPNGTGSIDTLVTLAPGQQAAITLTGTVPPATPTGSITNTAIVVPPPGTVATCPVGNPDCRTSTVLVGIGNEADVEVTKTVDEPAPSLNERVTFTIAARNLGPSDAPNVTLQELLPEGLLLVSATPSAGTFNPAAGSWSIGLLPVDGTPETLRVVAVVARAGSLTNTATVTGTGGTDGNTANDQGSSTVTAGGTDVEATRVWWLYNPEVDTLDFYMDITNRGTRPTSGPITVLVPLPAGTTFHMGPGDWMCEVVGQTNTVACTRADLTLQPGEQITLPLWTKGVPAESVSVYAHVTYAADSNAANNVAQLWPCCGGIERNIDPSVTPIPVVPVTEAVRAAAMLPETLPVETIDLVITQQAPTVSIVAGARQLAYTVTIANQGPLDAAALTVTDAIPAGTTVISATAATGACASGAVGIVCQWATLPVGGSVDVAVVLASPQVGVLAHVVSASAVDPEGVLTNNQAVLTTELPADPALDTDMDGLPNAWETTMGLDPAAADGGGDADGDGVSNLDEYLGGTHPRGFFRRYFAEGVSNAFFATELAVVNPDPVAPATVVLTAQREGDGYTHSHTRQLGALSRYQVTGADVLAGSGSFSTLLESDVPVAADRIIYWDAHHYGSSVESALPEPSTTWYFAEGATHGFSLYYLLQNPHPTETAQVEISYLLPAGGPVVKTYSVAPHSRFTIPVHNIPELAATDVSASVVSANGVAIVAERAMYRDAAGQAMGAGHASAGAPQAETSWFFAEGATGSFFNLYLLLANPGMTPAVVTARYQLPDGTSFTIPYDVAPQSRRTISVAGEDPRLGATSVAVTLTSTTPIVAERAMWWPGPSVSPEWYEAHDSLGATTTGTKWAVAGGSAGGPDGESTFVLIANQADVAGTARVTVIFEDGTHAEKEFPLAPTSRVTVDIAGELPTSQGRTFSAIVESVGGIPVPLVVESARYGSPQGILWGSGGAALATKLQ